MLHIPIKASITKQVSGGPFAIIFQHMNYRQLALVQPLLAAAQPAHQVTHIPFKDSANSAADSRAFPAEYRACC
jgi:hypothetical protein